MKKAAAEKKAKRGKARAGRKADVLLVHKYREIINGPCCCVSGRNGATVCTNIFERSS